MVPFFIAGAFVVYRSFSEASVCLKQDTKLEKWSPKTFSPYKMVGFFFFGGNVFREYCFFWGVMFGVIYVVSFEGDFLIAFIIESVRVLF